MAFNRVNGIKLHTQSIGQGTPLVLLHGLVLGNIASWYLTTGPLLSKKYRVLMYDLRGHGKSERVTTGYDVHTMVDDLAALLEAEGIERLSLAGHSYGGLIALHFALRFPERVTKLALIDIPLPASLMKGGNFDDIPDLKEQSKILPRHLENAFKTGRRQARKLLELCSFLYEESSLNKDIYKFDDVPDEALAGITCPTFLLFGDASPCLSTGKRLAKVLPNVALDIVASGHQIPIDNPEAMNKALTRFFDE